MFLAKNLEQEFEENLDQHSPQFVDLFKAKKGLPGQPLLNCLEQIKVSYYEIIWG